MNFVESQEAQEASAFLQSYSHYLVKLLVLALFKMYIAIIYEYK